MADGVVDWRKRALDAEAQVAAQREHKALLIESCRLLVDLLGDVVRLLPEQMRKRVGPRIEAAIERLLERLDEAATLNAIAKQRRRP